MRILMLDLDTLRPDHLGCYGYSRNTSPAIDSIAADGMRFDHYHCPDAPCLPSRAALLTGMFGIKNGAVGHGGTAADLLPYGENREFRDQRLKGGLFYQFRKAGLYAATVSTFAERHSSYWFNAGFNEIINCGGCGVESGEEIFPLAMRWLEANAEKDNWFLHVNFWDPHTPYRAPADFGNPFEREPGPEWITQDVLEQHLRHTGPHSVLDLNMFDDRTDPKYPRHPGKAETLAEVKHVFDGYDCGIAYMDGLIGKMLDFLKQKGLYDDLAVIVTSDHGENLGELGIYAEHATADEITTRIPMIVKWPGMKTGADSGFHYNLDLAPTVADLLGLPREPHWDGQSYAETLRAGADTGRDYLIVSQCAHVCQRSVRFGDYLYMKTYHCGYHLFPDEMLFDLKNDPYEQHDLAASRPNLCEKARSMLAEWEKEMNVETDPLRTVLREGGPHHGKRMLDKYCERLERTGRADGAAALRKKYPEKFA